MWPSTFTPDFLLGVRHVLLGDVAEIGNMLEVEAHRLAHEHFERHFIDRLSLRVHMSECIHVRAHVIEHRDEIGLEGHRIARAFRD